MSLNSLSFCRFLGRSKMRIGDRKWMRRGESERACVRTCATGVKREKGNGIRKDLNGPREKQGGSDSGNRKMGGDNEHRKSSHLKSKFSSDNRIGTESRRNWAGDGGDICRQDNGDSNVAIRRCVCERQIN